MRARVAPDEPDDLELGDDHPTSVAPRVPAEERVHDMGRRHEGWPRWVADPPDWFDDVWKARVPPRLIPQDDRPAQLVLPAPPAAADEGD